MSASPCLRPAHGSPARWPVTARVSMVIGRCRASRMSSSSSFALGPRPNAKRVFVLKRRSHRFRTAPKKSGSKLHCRRRHPGDTDAPRGRRAISRRCAHHRLGAAGSRSGVARSQVLRRNCRSSDAPRHRRAALRRSRGGKIHRRLYGSDLSRLRHRCERRRTLPADTVRVRRDAIGFIGHSEGGMVAQIAAAENADLDFVILLAAPGTNMMQLAQSQERLLSLSQGRSEADLARMQPVMAEVFDAVANSASAEDARARARAGWQPMTSRPRNHAGSSSCSKWRMTGLATSLQYKPAAFLVADPRARSGGERHARSPGTRRREPRRHQDRARAQQRRNYWENRRPQSLVPDGPHGGYR